MANETPAAPSTPAAPDLQALVVAMAKAITNHPDEVEVDAFEEDGVMVAELSVDPEDVGKVIGRQGRTVRSMRMILEAASEKMDIPWELDIVEDDDEDEEGDDLSTNEAPEGDASAS
jgi:predicted RNA-binding protein YlqC (UPF0109 family)